MTHYTINYEGLSEIEKHNKAIQDIKDYLGEAKFDEVTAIVKNSPKPYNLEQFLLAVSFAGIQGYPAKAWYNHCYPL